MVLASPPRNSLASARIVECSVFPPLESSPVVRGAEPLRHRLPTVARITLSWCRSLSLASSCTTLLSTTNARQQAGAPSMFGHGIRGREKRIRQRKPTNIFFFLPDNFTSIGCVACQGLPAPTLDFVARVGAFPQEPRNLRWQLEWQPPYCCFELTCLSSTEVAPAHVLSVWMSVAWTLRRSRAKRWKWMIDTA